MTVNNLIQTRAMQPMATCRQQPYLHKPAVMTSFSLWRHSLLSWPRPPLQTYRHLTAFNIQRFLSVKTTDLIMIRLQQTSNVIWCRRRQQHQILLQVAQLQRSITSSPYQQLQQHARVDATCLLSQDANITGTQTAITTFHQEQNGQQTVKMQVRVKSHDKAMIKPNKSGFI